MDAPGRAGSSTEFDSDCDALFPAGHSAHFGVDPGGDARGGGGYCVAVEEQSTVRPMGFARDVVASTGAWVPHLADAAAIRSFEIDAGRRLLGIAGFGQLGSTQFAFKF